MTDGPIFLFRDIGQRCPTSCAVPRRKTRRKEIGPGFIATIKDGTFTDVSHEMHLDKLLLTMGANFGDLDNDGWLDFYLGTGAAPLNYTGPQRNVPQP